MARDNIRNFCIIAHMTNRANWGLKEYRKYDPQALSDDPELYARLREKEYSTFW